MKYFNIKRYKFSTITRSLSKFTDNILDFLKIINLKKTYKYFEDKIYQLTKTFKYLDLRKNNIFNAIKKIKIGSNRFLFYHLPFAIIFFGLLYILIPTFFNYEKSVIERMICTTLVVKTFVFPDPAPATIRQGPSGFIIASF